MNLHLANKSHKKTSLLGTIKVYMSLPRYIFYFNTLFIQLMSGREVNLCLELAVPALLISGYTAYILVWQ